MSQRPSATVPESRVKETPVPLLKNKHCLDTGREQIDAPTPRPTLYGTGGHHWLDIHD